MFAKGSDVVSNVIGIYIAAASFYFVVVFGADVLNRYIQGKPWYPTKYISLSAICLTALAIAIKIPTDLTTPMTIPREQFLKLTGTILVCTAMANTMPSLGGMDGASTIISNVGAFVIIVFTIIVDLGIQIKTKIISVIWREQIVVMVIMFLQLLFVVSTAVVVPTTKELMEQQFTAKHNPQSEENSLAEDEEGENYVRKIKDNIIKYWFMARTSNPQFVVARSPTCIASCSLCLVTVGVMIAAILRIISHEQNTSIEESDYDSSVVISIFFIQIFAIILGTIGPASRCMCWSEVVFKNLNMIVKDGCFKVEAYWISSLVKWRDAPLRMNLKGILIRKIVRFFKWCVLSLMVKLQMVTVTLSKLIRAVSVVPMLLLHMILKVTLHRYFFHPATIAVVIYLVKSKNFDGFIIILPYIFIFFIRSYLVRLKKKFQLDTLNSMKDHQHSISSSYVLHLEGETGLESFITEDSRNNERNDKNKKKNKEKNAPLVRLLQENSTLTEGFKFVTAFRANTKSFSHPDLLHCSWALPLVTLSCIYITLPGVDRKQVKLLLEGVKQGLKFVNLIEQSFNDRSLINMKEASEFVWLGIDLDKKWFDFKLPIDVSNSEKKDAREVVEELKRIATNYILEFKDRSVEDAWNRPYEWPPKVLAADCMQTVCCTILQNYNGYEANMMLFQWLQTTVSDILGACLTNLPEVIYTECSKKSIEVREEGVWNAANLFVETEDLLVLLYDRMVASKYPERKKHIEDWQRRGVKVATDISTVEDVSCPVTTLQLGGFVIDVDHEPMLGV